MKHVVIRSLSLSQLLINQIINVLPVNTRDKINDAAATFNQTRNQFLLRCLKELQAFQEYSKIDFITAIQKTVKFVDDKLTDEQRDSLDVLEVPGIQLATLLFDNQLLPGELNKVYDLEVLVVRQKIDPQAFVDQLPILLEEILAQHL